MQRANIDVGLTGLDADGGPAGGQIGVDQGAEILVSPVATVPKLAQFTEHGAGHTECSPDPERRGIFPLTWISRTASPSSTTASNSSGRSTGNSRKLRMS